MPYTHFPQSGHEVVTRTQGDYLQFYYHLWLFADTVPGETPWFRDPYEFAVPQATSPLRTYFVPLSLISLISLIFSPLGGITAYNLLVLSSFVLSGLAGYLFALRFVRTPGPALLAGAIFGSAPQARTTGRGRNKAIPISPAHAGLHSRIMPLRARLP